MITRKITIRKLLRLATTMSLIDMPFGRVILLNCPDEIDLNPVMNAQDALVKLDSTPRGKAYLDGFIEDHLVSLESFKTRRLARYAFYTGLIGSFLASAVILWISLLNREMPDWTLLWVVLSVPAFVIWNQVGVFKADKAERVASVISTFSPSGIRDIMDRRSQRRDSDYRRYDDSQVYSDEDNYKSSRHSINPYDDEPTGKQ